MVWEPFAIAVVFGLVVSAGLYFIVMWPQVEPHDDDDVDVVYAELAATAEAAPVAIEPDPVPATSPPGEPEGTAAAPPDPPITES